MSSFTPTTLRLEWHPVHPPELKQSNDSPLYDSEMSRLLGQQPLSPFEIVDIRGQTFGITPIHRSIFDRQPGAQRIEFGTGFEDSESDGDLRVGSNLRRAQTRKDTSDISDRPHQISATAKLPVQRDVLERNPYVNPQQSPPPEYVVPPLNTHFNQRLRALYNCPSSSRTVCSTKQPYIHAQQPHAVDYDSDESDPEFIPADNKVPSDVIYEDSLPGSTLSSRRPIRTRRNRIRKGSRRASSRLDAASTPSKDDNRSPLSSDPPYTPAAVPKPPDLNHYHELREARSTTRVRRHRRNRPWSTQEERALVAYITRFGPQWRVILNYDAGIQGEHLLTARSNVDIKDKAINMTVVMIQSGAPVHEAFRGLISMDSARGRQLYAAGHRW